MDQLPAMKKIFVIILQWQSCQNICDDLSLQPFVQVPNESPGACYYAPVSYPLSSPASPSACVATPSSTGGECNTLPLFCQDENQKNGCCGSSKPSPTTCDSCVKERCNPPQKICNNTIIISNTGAPAVNGSVFPPCQSWSFNSDKWNLPLFLLMKLGIITELKV